MFEVLAYAILPGYRKYRVHKHVIFYCMLPNSLNIEIVRIWHERMDMDPGGRIGKRPFLLLLYTGTGNSA